MIAGKSSNKLKIYLVKSGRSHYLLKRSITNKKKEQQRFEQEQKELMLISSDTLKDQIKLLKSELLEKEKLINDHQNDSRILKDLFNKGFIDQDGNVI